MLKFLDKKRSRSPRSSKNRNQNNQKQINVVSTANEKKYINILV